MPANKNTIIFSCDLEDHTGQYNENGRFVKATEDLLEKLAVKDIKGTFFVVGKLAQTHKTLIRKVSGSGHEIACHSYKHLVLTKDTPVNFRKETLIAKQELEDCTGRKVNGFRAPVFSLTPESKWALDILAELGFTYSSSIMPTKNSLNSWPEAPKVPFIWPQGIIEFPCPTGNIGSITFPYLGGVYMRYLPFVLTAYFERISAANDHVRWTYCHPYDFDTDEPLTRIEGTSWPISFILWCNRGSTWTKINKLYENAVSRPFADFMSDKEFITSLKGFPHTR